MKIRFDTVVYRLASASGMVIAMYAIAGWDIREPFAAYGFMVLALTVNDWIEEKIRVLKLGKANRANKMYTRILYHKGILNQ